MNDAPYDLGLQNCLGIIYCIIAPAHPTCCFMRFMALGVCRLQMARKESYWKSC